MKKTVYIVNAFTYNNNGGNSAGVVLDCENLTTKDMLSIANTVGLSETAFVKKSNCPAYDYEVRFFTPTTEVDLCGHATIASFYTLAKRKLITGSNDIVKVKQKTLSGILDVELHFKSNEINYVLMTQTSPEFYSYIDDTPTLCEILGISETDCGINGVVIKPMIVSTGLKDIMFPVKSLEVLKNIKPDFSKLKDYTDRLALVGLHAFTLETEEESSSVATRNFGPSVGIDEESATGTSNGALCGYLIKHNILSFDKVLNMYSEQGYYMGNPSRILCSGEPVNDEIIIKVGGEGAIMEEITVEF